MNQRFDINPNEHPIFLRIAAFATLMSVLARLFSYPSKNDVEDIVSLEFLEGLQSLLVQASIDDEALSEILEQLEKGERSLIHQEGLLFRAEYTRLFITPPFLISLEGSRWVKSRTTLSKKRGEKCAMKKTYQKLGLRSRQDTKDPVDHLVSELDYLSYVARAEAGAWEGGDIMSAREWRKLGYDFMEWHLVDMANGVSSGIRQVSNNTVMQMCGALLRVVVVDGIYGHKE